MLPTIQNDLSLWCAVLLPGLFVFGYLTHELLHVIPLEATGTWYVVDFAPSDKSMLWDCTFGRAFEFQTDANPRLAIVSLLAPGVLTIPGWIAWAWLLQSSVVSLTAVLFVAMWIVVFLPSMADWVEASRQWQLLRG